MHMGLVGVGAAALALGTAAVVSRPVHAHARDAMNVPLDDQPGGGLGVLAFSAGMLAVPGALVGTWSLLDSGKVPAALGVAMLGGAAAGVMFGLAGGASEGSELADTRFGPTIDDEVDALMERFDIDGSDRLEIGARPKLAPERTDADGLSEDRLLGWADTDRDEIVTRHELQLIHRRFDEDGSGKLSFGEREDLEDYTDRWPDHFPDD